VTKYSKVSFTGEHGSADLSIISPQPDTQPKLQRPWIWCYAACLLPSFRWYSITDLKGMVQSSRELAVRFKLTNTALHHVATCMK